MTAESVIHKYPWPLPAGDGALDEVHTLDGPIIHVGIQGGTPMLWVRGPARTTTARLLCTVATGQAHDATLVHRGTVIDEPTGLVWHLMEQP